MNISHIPSVDPYFAALDLHIQGHYRKHYISNTRLLTKGQYDFVPAVTHYNKNALVFKGKESIPPL